MANSESKQDKTIRISAGVFILLTAVAAAMRLFMPREFHPHDYTGALEAIGLFFAIPPLIGTGVGILFRSWQAGLALAFTTLFVLLSMK